ncbi:MAG TPA: RecX family transcriptional regulator [Gaiellaceae bacterium]
MRVVTGLRERPRGRVEVDLDGAPWRLVPADAVVRSGLAVGRALDRETARALGRELRRSEALDIALRALRYRDQSRQRLEERLERRGTPAEAREDAIEALERAGLVDDARVAAVRAQALAERGYGDAAIRFALEAEGLPERAVVVALSSLELEVERARGLLAARGKTLKTVRWLAGKGFDPTTLEDVAGFADGA